MIWTYGKQKYKQNDEHKVKIVEQKRFMKEGIKARVYEVEGKPSKE